MAKVNGHRAAGTNKQDKRQGNKGNKGRMVDGFRAD